MSPIVVRSLIISSFNSRAPIWAHLLKIFFKNASSVYIPKTKHGHVEILSARADNPRSSKKNTSNKT